MVDKKAVEELAEQFRRNSGKASSSTNTNYSMNMKMMKPQTPLPEKHSKLIQTEALMKVK